MSGRPLPIICVGCRRNGLHAGRGLCVACYSRHSNNHTLDRFPSVRGDTDWQNRHRLDRLAASNRGATRPTVEAADGWDARGACRLESPDAFFPVSYHANDPRVKHAKQVCRSCPVFHECTAFVRDNPQDHGIWAASTPPERRRALTATAERTPA